MRSVERGPGPSGSHVVSEVTTPLVPPARLDQAEPFHAAILLAGAPPTVVNEPAAMSRGTPAGAALQDVMALMANVAPPERPDPRPFHPCGERTAMPTAGTP